MGWGTWCSLARIQVQLRGVGVLPPLSYHAPPSKCLKKPRISTRMLRSDLTPMSSSSRLLPPHGRGCVAKVRSPTRQTHAWGVFGHATPAASATLRRLGSRLLGRKRACLAHMANIHGWAAWGPRWESATPTVPRGSSRRPLPDGEARVRRATRSGMAALRGGYEHSPKHFIDGTLAATHMRGRYNDPWAPRYP